MLFNLKEDPAETTNLAEREPAVLQKLLARLKVLAEGSVEPQQWTKPYQGEDYYCKDCPLHPHGTGPASPWLPWYSLRPPPPPAIASTAATILYCLCKLPGARE